MERERGGGIMDGFRARRRKVPNVAIRSERRRLGRERSTRYQRTGLISARVRETWSVDVHGILRCR